MIVFKSDRGSEKRTLSEPYDSRITSGCVSKNDVDHVELEVTYRERSYQAELRKVSLEGFSEKEELLQIPEEQEYLLQFL